MTATMRPNVYASTSQFLIGHTWASTAEGVMTSESCNVANDTWRLLKTVPGYRVVNPIPYHVESRGNDSYAVDEAFDRYGVGQSADAAREDLAVQLADYFNMLRSDFASLAPCALRDYRAMRRYVSANS